MFAGLDQVLTDDQRRVTLDLLSDSRNRIIELNQRVTNAGHRIPGVTQQRFEEYVNSLNNGYQPATVRIMVDLCYQLNTDICNLERFFNVRTAASGHFVYSFPICNYDQLLQAVLNIGIRIDHLERCARRLR